MKKLITLPFVFLALFNCYPQGGIIGYDQYRSYKMNVYIDNMLKESIPDNLNVYYYSGLNDKDLINKSQEYDTIRKEHNVYVYTKKAKDGYLFVNEGLLNHIKNECYDTNKLIITYLINGDFVDNKKRVYKLLLLRKKKIKNIEYNYLPESILEVSIYMH